MRKLINSVGGFYNINYIYLIYSLAYFKQQKNNFLSNLWQLLAL